MVDDIEFDEEQDEPLDAANTADFSQAVLYASDWTVETILSQLAKENIQLNPNFQRRDAWGVSRKSRFIESVVLGLPVPQLVLAEAKGQRGRFIVLDGKQRLLSLLRFTESRNDRSQGFGLSSLEIRPDLSRKRYYNFVNDHTLSDVLDAFLNYTIRTVVIRNWPNNDFLHQVFLRLNTGSVKLSAQELRQAIAPGEFTTFADEFSANSLHIQSLLGRDTPDPRMRDVELLVRHIGFRDHLPEYRGRLKSFLDGICASENQNWEQRSQHVAVAAQEFERAIQELTETLAERLARKPNSRSFNRAAFDALAYYAADPTIRGAMAGARQRVRDGYSQVMQDRAFLNSIESDTAGLPNTVARLRIWGQKLQEVLALAIQTPRLTDEGQIVLA